VTVGSVAAGANSVHPGLCSGAAGRPRNYGCAPCGAISTSFLTSWTVACCAFRVAQPARVIKMTRKNHLASGIKISRQISGRTRFDLHQYSEIFSAAFYIRPLVSERLLAGCRLFGGRRCQYLG